MNLVFPAHAYHINRVERDSELEKEIVFYHMFPRLDEHIIELVCCGIVAFCFVLANRDCLIGDVGRGIGVCVPAKADFFEELGLQSL